MVYRRSSDARSMPLPDLPGLAPLLEVMEYRCFDEVLTLDELLEGDPQLDPSASRAAFEWLAEHRFVRVNKNGTFRAELRIRALQKRLRVGLHHPRRRPSPTPAARKAPAPVSRGPSLQLLQLPVTVD